MRFMLAALAFAFCSAAAAQGVFKCKDKAGKITYAAQECGEIGLLPAGEIKEINTAPAQRVAPPAAPSPKAQAKPATIAESKPEASAEDPANPNRRCFTVKTAKGTATRCNEKPTEPDKPQ